MSKKIEFKSHLERMKLMMEYDSSKTLKENESGLIKEYITLPLSAAWFASTFPVATIAAWYYASKTAGTAPEKVKKFFEGCSSMKGLIPSSDVNHKEAANQIYNAINGLTTDEDAIKNALSSMKTPADLCKLKEVYEFRYDDLYDDIDSDIDGADWKTYVWTPIADIIESNKVTAPPSTQRQQNINNMWCSVQYPPGGGSAFIVAPGSSQNGKKWSVYAAENNVTSSELELAKASCPKNENNKIIDGDKKRRRAGTKFVSCPETFPISQNCKNNKIKEIQACLNMPSKYQTGNFGPITQGYLERAGVSGTEITQDSYNKVCNKTATTTIQPDENPEQETISGIDDNF